MKGSYSMGQWRMIAAHMEYIGEQIRMSNMMRAARYEGEMELQNEEAKLIADLHITLCGGNQELGFEALARQVRHPFAVANMRSAVLN